MEYYNKYNAILLVIVFLCQFGLSKSSSMTIENSWDYHDFSTEPPELVEIFDPRNWVSQAVLSQQIEIKRLKMETQVKLRYARTRIILHLANPHYRELQADFKIALPDNAFFTAFQLKRGSNPRTYSAQIVKRDLARKIYHSARTGANGTVSAGFIELSQKADTDLLHENVHFYNLKVSLPPEESLQVFLVYERQLERVSNAYSDSIQVFPSNPLVKPDKVGQVEFSVNVEELESIRQLRCKEETEDNFSKCTKKAKKKLNQYGRQHKYRELTWRGTQVDTGLLQNHSFSFHYELEHRNDTTSAVVIAQNNGNFYFVHLLIPENLPPIPKHIVFLLDISDSMHGKKLDQLQWSMNEILNDLGPQDFFNIIAFANDITVFQPVDDDELWEYYQESSENRGDLTQCSYPYPATEEYKRHAVRFIQEELIAHGTTDIYLGLNEAFRLIRVVSSDEASDICAQNGKKMLPDNVESMIFFLSDGQATTGPTNTSFLLKAFYDINHNFTENGIPVHSIAYGENADVPFLRKLSSLNSGVNKVIMEESAAGIELKNFYNEISSPVLSQVKTSMFSLNGSSPAQISSPVTVIQGGEVVTAGKLEGQTKPSLNWSTEAIGKTGRLAYYNSPIYDCTNLQMTIGRCVDRINFYLERLQAYQLLKKLLERDKLVENGYICPQSYHDQFQDLKMARLTSYTDYESENPNCYNIFKQQATELALKHGFVTPYSSFILTTAETDSGLNPEDQPPDSEEVSIERRFLPPPQVRTEKLILMRSVDTSERRLDSLRMMEESPISSLEEMVPTASMLVKEISHLNNDTIANNASTTAKPKTNKALNITKSVRDAALKVLKKLFPSVVLPTFNKE